MIGFHSTMDNPDSVSRVAPPTISVPTISAATTISQRRTARSRGVLAVVLSRLPERVMSICKTAS